jgi:hypothetical protein
MEHTRFWVILRVTHKWPRLTPPLMVRFNYESREWCLSGHVSRSYAACLRQVTCL